MSQGSGPAFSLIISTRGRDWELARLLTSLTEQSFKDFEVIIVDQNEDDRVFKIIANFKDVLPITYLTSPPGLSLGRNVGLKVCRGKYVAFPDDDSTYFPNTLAEAVRYLDMYASLDSRLGGVVGVRADHWEESDCADQRRCNMGARISISDVFRKASSYLLFFKREAVYDFDETLGVGSGTPWGSGEEIDLMLQAMKAGYRFYMVSTVCVYHPFKEEIGNPSRTRSYLRGVGRVMRKHKLFWLFVYYSLRSLGGILASIGRRDFALVRHYFRVLIARTEGFFGIALKKGD
ncbi:glycosyltransferase family 2 protein [Thermus sp. LT1-2-5]|uniref:glycosyltransferase family 2 protein n=1 Tax=Thermus sp. LT1-2-5 TaxID=3026935 RepID=UPI0033658E91